ncbi:MAG: serine/threonine-protein kinase, partial [Myxococcota bacterium]
MEQLGDYRLLDELARGTTGRVFASSRWPALGGHNLIALKLLNPDLGRNERFLMLLREGVARFGGFQHPGVAPVLEVGGNVDQMVIASELVDGQPLDRVLRFWTEQETEIDPIIALWIGSRVTSVLSAAHEHDIIHGHLSPDQIMITYDGEVRLLGLGLGEARCILPLPDRRRSFLSPEVVRTGLATVASDVHCLGRTLHHVLAGVNSLLSLSGNDVPAWLPPLRSYGVTIHPAIEAMIEDMLEAAPNARPPLTEVEGALFSAVSSRDPSIRSQLARLLQGAFTPDHAAATIRRRRATRGSDDVRHRDDYFVPKTPSRAISFEQTGRFPAVRSEKFNGETSEDDKANNGLTSSIPSAKDRRAGVPTPSEAMAEVSATDPRLEAMDYGTDESLMALVDEIVNHATLPQNADEPEDDVDAFEDVTVSTSRAAIERAPLVPSSRMLDQIHGHTGADVSDLNLDSKWSTRNSSSGSSERSEMPTDPGISPSGDLPAPEPLPPEAVSPEALFTGEVTRLPAGAVIGERYKVEGVIGEGGVSVVYRGSHSFLRKDVAIKVLRAELATLPPVVERFHREARSVAQLDHPNIVRVIDFGKTSTGSLFLVMDLIEGISLAEQIEKEGWLAPTNAVRIVSSILTGLEHAHGRGVIHRDLKPDN